MSKYFGKDSIDADELYDTAYNLAKTGNISTPMGMLWLSNIHSSVDFDLLFYRIVRGYIECPKFSLKRLTNLVSCTVNVKDDESMLSIETDPSFLLRTTAPDARLIKALTLIAETLPRLASQLQDPGVSEGLTKARRKKLDGFVEKF